MTTPTPMTPKTLPAPATVRRRDAATRLRSRTCGLCQGRFTSDLDYGEETDGIPDLGVEECSQCGALWQMEEEAWMDDLRGGTGMLVRGPIPVPNANAEQREEKP